MPVIVTYKNFRRKTGLATLGFWLLMALPQSGWGAACEAVFTNGVQSHGAAGYVDAGYQTQISGGSRELDTPVLITQSPPDGASCGNGNGNSPCSATGSPAAKGWVNFSYAEPVDGDINVGLFDYPGENHPEGDYGAVNVLVSLLAFTSEGGNYHTQNFSVSVFGGVAFAGGDYWIDGNFIVGGSATLVHDGSGPVRLFVDGDVQFDGSTEGFAPGNLLIYATGDITLGNGANISGFLYAEGTLTTGEQSLIEGGVSGYNVILRAETQITYDEAAINNADFEPFCGDDATSLPTPWAHWSFDEPTWTGSAEEVRDISGNSQHGTAAGDADTAGTTPALAGDPGTCRYGEFDGQDDYVQVSDLSSILNTTASLAFWINTQQTGGASPWQSPGIAGVEQEGGTDDIFWGWLDGAGAIGITVGNDDSSVSNEVISGTGWRHVVLTRDHQGGRYQIFIDGSLDSEGSIAMGEIGNGYSSLGRIENTGSAAPQYFDGLLDEVRVYNGVLNESQANALMQQTRPCAAQLCPAGAPAGGLQGDYYQGTNLSGEPVGSRVDGPINFNWTRGNPGVPGVGDDNFSVEWSGQLRVEETGQYRFQTVSDDGIRLWLEANGSDQLLIDEWADHSRQTDTSDSVFLIAGRTYPIRMHYYENTLDAEIRLRWRTPSNGPYRPIPAGPTPAVGAGLYHCISTQVAEYQLTHSANGVTCEAEPVEVTALDENGDPVAPSAGTEIGFEATPGNAETAWVGGSGYTFTGTEESVTKYLRQTSPADLTLNVTDSNGVTGVSSEIRFADAGLRFYGNAALDPMAHQVAGQENPEPVLRAVETNSDTGACEARVEGGAQVDLAYECLNPASCVAGQTATLAGTPIPGNDNGTDPGYGSVPLTFNAQGIAAIPFDYEDVGQLRLLARLDLPEDGEQPATRLAGASAPFVVKPHTLAVTQVADGSGQPNPGGTGGGPAFVTGGDTFSARVQALNAEGNPTPNFGREATPESVRLEVTDLAYPAGGEPGNLSSAGPGNFTLTGAGEYQNDALSWNNVGSIQVTPFLDNDDYLSAGDLPATTQSEPIGRFYPHEMVLTGASAADACGNFTYMHQDAISLEYQLEARLLTGALATNYDNATLGYVGTAVPQYLAENADEGIDRGGRLIETEGGQWQGGRYQVSNDRVSFNRQGSTEPDGPLSQLQLGLALTGEIDGRPLAERDMNPATSGDCATAGDCSAVALGDTLDLRFGRLRLESAYGPEVTELPAPFYTEYWDGERFVPSTADHCTRIAPEDLHFPDGDLTNEDHRQVSVGAGTSTARYDLFDTSSGVSLTSGRAGQVFTAPGAGNTGNFDIQIDLSPYPWLRYDWDADDNHNNNDQLPPARIGFGSYRGHDRVIYWRELFD